MPDLEVDVDGLENVVNSLKGVADGLDNTRSVIDASWHELGSGDVADALDSFEDKWDDGRGQIKKNMEGVESVLTQAVQQYRDADQQLTDALKKDETTNTNMTAG